MQKVGLVCKMMGWLRLEIAGAIDLAMRNQVKQIVAAENNDRRALYQASRGSEWSSRMGAADSANICTSLDS